MAPYEALYGRKCCTPLCWAELGENKAFGLDLVQETKDVVSPWKNVLIFGRKGKLSPRFTGPYRVLKMGELVAYQLELPLELDCIHDVFHVFMLRIYHSDPSHEIPLEKVEVRSDLTYEEEPVQILDREVRKLRKNQIPLVKVLWQNHSDIEATWEPGEAIRR
ncbi:uncharacterized protein LOC105795714 [Gossypium raimondii]|uniref:uncharacterized protein LOC105795714 n=1 Tax=Gossypium raimondii TaxID=29730 RepID=UPI00063AB392|nr:uncharacterized protein LOC105795714 [Gossypium raimondii]